MKKLIVTIALLLCFVLCAFGLSSCKKDPAETSGTASSDVTPSDATTNKWEPIGEEVRAFAEANRSFKIQYDMNSTAERTSKNDTYIQGPDKITPGVNSDGVPPMVYARNRAVEKLLGVHIDYVRWDEAWGKQWKKINQLVQSTAADAPDLFIDMIYDLNCCLRNYGSFRDIKSLPGSYFDFEADGWLNDWMESMSFTGDRSYLLAGDYFMELFRAFGVMPFNVDLMDENAEKLAPVIMGRQLNEGEKLSTKFFDFVEQGKWTWETLGQLCDAIWVDGDGDDSDSYADTLGFITDTVTGLPASLIVYSTGETIFSVYEIEDETDPLYKDYAGKTWLKYPDDPSALGAVFDAVSSVFAGRGSFVTTDKTTAKGLASHYQKFSENTLLFAGAAVLGVLEDEVFQSMNKLYSVVPLPKVSVDKNYNTVIHNVGDAGAINANTPVEKARTISAFLQYCTENSVEIRKEYQQVVAKFKSVDYNQGSDRMLDLIYDSVYTGRDKALEDLVRLGEGNQDFAFAALIRKSKDDDDNKCFQTGSAYLATQYEASKGSKSTELNETLKKWYSLPVFTPSQAE